MSKGSFNLLAALLLFIAMCNAAAALTVMPLGAHWLIWGLPLVSSFVDVVAAVVIIYQNYTGPTIVKS